MNVNMKVASHQWHTLPVDFAGNRRMNDWRNLKVQAKGSDHEEGLCDWHFGRFRDCFTSSRF